MVVRYAHPSNLPKVMDRVIPGLRNEVSVGEGVRRVLYRFATNVAYVMATSSGKGSRKTKMFSTSSFESELSRGSIGEVSILVIFPEINFEKSLFGRTNGRADIAILHRPSKQISPASRTMG
jgi:hypothetical protein